METNLSNKPCSVTKTALHTSEHGKKCYPMYVLQDLGQLPELNLYLESKQYTFFCGMILL